MLDAFIIENTDFVTWGFQHGMVVLFFVLLCIFLFRIGKQQSSEDKKWRILKYQGITLSATVIIWTLLEILTGNFDYKEDLPFLICNFMALVFPLFVTSRSTLIFEIMYFWILVATVQAIITPDLVNGFPHYHFLKFWIVHCGLVVALLYTIYVLNYRPFWKSIVRSFLALELFIVLMFGINYVLDANYMYLNKKPDFPTALDALGDYPWYIIRAHLVVIPVFVLFYLPYAIKDFLGKKKQLSS